MTLSADSQRRALLSVFEAALERVSGRGCVRRELQSHPLGGPWHLIAIGKPAAAMARGALDALGAQIVSGLVITKHGYAAPLPWPCLTAGHPHPDAASLHAGEALLGFIDAIPETGQVLVLLAGGASVLVERLPDGVTLEQWRDVNDWLLGAGLDIHALNFVRKRISLIKGGRLARRLAPRRVRCLIISDVPGDDPAVIGSGPLVADSAANARSPFPIERAPDLVRELLAKAAPAPSAGDPAFGGVELKIVATLDEAKTAAVEAAKGQGYRVRLEPEFVRGDAVAAGERLAQALTGAEPGSFWVWGGETQVTLPEHPGQGGRCQSLALAAARSLRGRDDLFLLAAGTDGTDGPGEEAGALVDGGTIDRGESAGFDALRALEHADAGTFLAASGDLVRTGPTGTNVMDLILGLRCASKDARPS